MLELGILLSGIIFLVGMTWLMRKRRVRFGPAAVGMLEPFMLHAQRQAAEIIVEGKAEARDQEHKDGNLPDLAGPASALGKAGERPASAGRSPSDDCR
jgi:hypothetical protein